MTHSELQDLIQRRRETAAFVKREADQAVGVQKALQRAAHRLFCACDVADRILVERDISAARREQQIRAILLAATLNESCTCQ
jgi:hypothetical protein